MDLPSTIAIITSVHTKITSVTKVLKRSWITLNGISSISMLYIIAHHWVLSCPFNLSFHGHMPINMSDRLVNGCILLMDIRTNKESVHL